ncbi:exodeoxyribonuclease V subunit gamma [Ferrimonas marina]|uniref:RecBCD enzyme subunit RecC n=1 Tax=Ferrimonas marina TaxID=299255 RepID=A0A1M5RA20_9GAMM|nr:exodeoxyribonuclease V subunit gamma [Ferrimonas marina]SHH23101.1 DNA helicase/exodeoxyribonuclease V, gamma subunit [Ferrimonas marina]
MTKQADKPEDRQPDNAFNQGPALTPGLMMLHSNRMEDLRELVVQWLKGHPLAPLEPETFLVQSNGMAQWLKLAMAADDGLGIAAAMSLQMPSRFIWQIYRTVLGEAAVPKDSPFDKPQLRWRLLRLLPELLADPHFAPLKRFLADDTDLRKRDQLSEQLADLFDQYQVYRADWLAAWGEGRDVVISATGFETPVPNEQAWQPKLWRAILADLGPQERVNSRATLHQRFLQRIADEMDPERWAHALPRRVIVFGLSALPQQSIEVLAALAPYCQILLCVQNPCQHYWGDIIEHKELLKRQLLAPRHQRKPGLPEVMDEASQHPLVNPLLAAWGKQGRDYIGMLYEYDQPEQYQGAFERIDLFSSPLLEGEPSLLSQLQAGIFELDPVPQPPAPVSPEDDSIRFALAHSRQREVEALQDELLRRFAADPSLRPTDVIVMMPDVTAYAPHIEAVFGQLDRRDPRYLPFAIADRPERGFEPLVLALESLLSLTESRFAVSELLDLLAVPALRARFAIEEAQLPLLQRWVEQAGVRWGLDAQQRRSLALPEDLEQNTWHFGLQRMLLGYAVGRGEPWAGIEPFDEIGGLDAALVGSLSRLLTHLGGLWRALQQPRTPAQWVEQIRSAYQSLFAPQDEHEQQLLLRLDEALVQWQQSCEQSALAQPLPLTVVKPICMAPFSEGGVSQKFLAGRINFGTLMPMRAIPFRQVCLLGMNDEDYPRSRPPMDFDLMADRSLGSQYRPGDRSRREDDRYLFLEALLAARDHLYISYLGRNARDNSERPPSVLVGQLQDHLRQGYRLDGPDADERALLAHLTLDHPLQPFSRRYFDGSDPRLRTHSQEWRAVHQAREGSAAEPLSLWQPEAPIGLAELAALFRDPVRLLITRRLGVWLHSESEAADDLEPFALDGLEAYQIRTELMAVLNDSEPEQREAVLAQRVARLRGRGQLPMGAFAELASDHLAQPALAAFERAQSLLADSEMMDALECYHKTGALELEAWLTDLRQSAQLNGVLRLECEPKALLDSRGQLKNPLALVGLYLAHLAACNQGLSLTSYYAGSDSLWQIEPISASEAGALLDRFLDLYRQAMSEPLPIGPRAALAQLAQQDPRGAFEGGGFSFGDRDRSPYIARQFSDFSQLDEARFIELADQLYGPLLSALQRADA